MNKLWKQGVDDRNAETAMVEQRILQDVLKDLRHQLDMKQSALMSRNLELNCLRKTVS